MGTCYLHILLALVLSIQFFTNVGAPPPSNMKSFSKRTAFITRGGPGGVQTASYSSDDRNAGSIDDFWANNGVKADSRGFPSPFPSSFRSNGGQRSPTRAASPTCLSKSPPPGRLFSNDFGQEDPASLYNSMFDDSEKLLTPALKTRFSSDNSDMNPFVPQSPPRSMSSPGRRPEQKSLTSRPKPRASSPQASRGRRSPQRKPFTANPDDGSPYGPGSQFSQSFGNSGFGSGDFSDTNFDPFASLNSNSYFQAPGFDRMTGPKPRNRSQQGSRFQKTNSSNGNRSSPKQQRTNSKPSGGFAAGVPNELAQIILDKHNEYRARHGVPPLTYDPELSQLSQTYAVKLATGKAAGHNPEAIGRDLGENLAQGMSSAGDGLETNGAKSVDRWYNEVRTYQYGQPPMSEGHFTQVIWAASERLGIGMHNNPATGKWAVVCNYDPQGNLDVPWENAYEKNVPRPIY